MAGSHRATRVKERPRVSGRAAALAVAVVMLPLAWFAFNQASDDADPVTDRGALGVPTASTTATSTAAPTTTPTAKPTKTTPPALPRLAPDVPRRLASGSFLDVGFDNSIEARNGSFRAASTDEVARWGSRGLPASPGTDTVYIVGTTRPDGTGAFGRLPRLKPGAAVTLRTDRGRLTYTVVSAADRPTGGLANNDAFAAKVPGRLILVGLRADRSGDATGTAYVVVAQLSGVRPG